MIRRHVTQFLIASSCALGLGPIAANEAFAQGGPGPMGEGMMHEGMHRGAGPMMHMMRELDLTEAQRDQIFKIQYDQMPAMREQMKQVRKARDELRQLALADKFDEARARQLADTQGKAMSALALMHMQTMRRVRDILTPEQRQKVQQIQERHGAGPRGKG